ncbi:MAG: PAS domain S-box protein, partial [Gudongella sp.]|nr:PAS domain S-box protein [Gudongella sp.]
TTSEDMYRHLAGITDQIIMFVNLNGKILEANKAAVNAYGYTYEELCDLNITDLRADFKNVEKQISIASSRGIIFEAVHRRKDGSYFDVEVSSRSMILNGKKILGSIIKDVTERKEMEREILKQKELFSKVFEESPIGMAFGKPEGGIIDGNKVYQEILGRSIDELRILGWEAITHQDDINKDADKFARYLAGKEKKFSTYKRYIKPDGSIVWGSLTLAPLNMDDKANRMNIIMLEDVTEQVESREKLRQSDEFKEVIISNIPGVVFRCDNDENWTMHYISEGCLDLTGYSPECLLNNQKLSFNDLIDPEYRETLRVRWAEALKENENFKSEYQLITASGEKKWVFEQGHGIYDDKGKVIALEGLIIDITDRKEKEDEIMYLNYHDVLTGLYNRRFIDAHLATLDDDKNYPISVIIGDINGLKQINDALGHASGDELIIAVSRIISEHIKGLGIVARTGGDDFTILLPETNNKAAIKIMKDIETDCNVYFDKSRRAMFNTSISLGCATKENDTYSLMTIIKNAEDSMYRNKLLQNESMHSYAISSMKAALLEKSQETEEHALRLIKISRAIGEEMMLSVEELNELELLSTLHDIGKIGISDSIINKPGKLTDEEWVQMKKHPEIGYRIAITTKELAPIARYILCHHERYDGNGYPQGLSGKDIPLLARIIAVADAFDAMTEDRAYRRAMPEEAAIQEIIDNSGTQFDPDVVKVFLSIIEKTI